MDNSLRFLWGCITVVIFITLHLKVFALPITSNFDVSLAFLLIPFWVFWTFKIRFLSFNRYELLLLLIFFILPFVTSTINDWGEFFKTYGQYVISYYLVFRVIRKAPRIEAFTVRKTIFAFQILLLSVTIIQFILVNILDFDARNIFGDLQLYYQQEEMRSGIQRMKAFYLEPSYLGFVAFNIFWGRYYLNQSKNIFGLNFIFTIIILVLANSALGFLGLFAIILFEMYKKIKRVPTVIGLGLFFMISLLGYFFATDLSNIFRLQELDPNSDAVSSGLFRIVLPVKALYQMFQEGYIFGLTFGQFDQYIEKMMTFKEHAEGSISNSFLLLIGYFGALTIFIYSVILFIYLKIKNRILQSFILLSFINLNNSGAFVTIQYAFVAILIPILIISIYEKYEKNINNYSRT